METFFCFAKNISCTLFLSSFSSKSSTLDKHIAELTIAGNNRQTRLQCGQITGIPRIAYNRSSWNSATTFPRARAWNKKSGFNVCLRIFGPENRRIQSRTSSEKEQRKSIGKNQRHFMGTRYSNHPEKNAEFGGPKFSQLFSHRNRELKSYRCLQERFKNALSICD